MREILLRRVRERLTAELWRRWEERRDARRKIRSVADLSDRELVALLGRGSEVEIYGLEELAEDDIRAIVGAEEAGPPIVH